MIHTAESAVTINAPGDASGKSRDVGAEVQLLLHCRDAIRAQVDSVCLERAHLVTDAYRLYAEEPMSLRRAHAFAHVLRHMTLDLDTNPFFAGNMSSGPRAWMLLPDYGFDIPSQAIVEKPSLAGLLDGEAIPAALRDEWRTRSVGGGSDVGHLTVDYAALLARGLNAWIEEAEAEAKQDTPSYNSDQTTYRQACAIACRAVIEWAQRYAAAAEAWAAQTSDPVRAAALRRLASACRHVPAKPARDLFEALQAIVLVQLAIQIEGHGYSVSPGRLDQVLWPYYQHDEDATTLLAAFMLKLYANSLWGSHSKTQTITVGGVDATLRDQSNALTQCVLDACDLLHVPDPAVFLRWHTNLAPAVKARALHMLSCGVSMPMLIGDEQTASGLIHAGIAAPDAWDYCVVGCNELGVPGKLIFDSVPVNEVELLRDVLLGDLSLLNTRAALIDGVKQKLIQQLQQQVMQKQAQRRAWAVRVPTPFTSALMDGCLARGEDMHTGLMYPHLNVRIQAYSNFINALAAIQDVVFEQHAVTLPEIAHALATNFRADGGQSLRRRLLRAAKWGNDDPQVDALALEWLRARDEAIRTVAAQPGMPPLLTEMVIRSLHHVESRDVGATPDGRLAGEPFADSVGAVVGTAVKGPTALLNSIRKMQPACYWNGGYNLNLTLPAADWRGDEMQARLLSLMDAFFANGGQELQINCLDAATLRLAQVRPEQHADLMVRIAGFNARFVDLSPLEQDELIRRADVSAVSERM
jgi:formate C-acetyltransferase